MGMSIRTAEQAGAWLEGLINHERQASFRNARLDLEPIRRLLSRLGHPEQSLSIVHVAGSKGKGSTCLLAEAVLQAAGERVGTFTSPHLERWTERFRVGGQEVPGLALAAAVEAVRPHVEALIAADAAKAPTFFDATTAAALVLFARSNVDRVVLEVGLGGRLDSTNAVDPVVTVVTQIELEHTDRLGTTLAAIAGEKAGIIKAGVPCVVGDLAAEALEVVCARARFVGAPVARLGHEFRVERSPGSGTGSVDDLPRPFLYREDDFEIDDLTLPVLGEHQLGNAALAIAAIRRLDAHSEEKLARAARIGLAAVRLPGRLELIRTRPHVLIDAAHTRESIRALASVLAGQPAVRRHIVISISSDKDAAGILAALSKVADEFWITRADRIRSLDPDTLARLASERAPSAILHCIEDPRAAVRAAYQALGVDDLLCCTGSVFLAGAARGALRELGLGSKIAQLDI